MFTTTARFLETPTSNLSLMSLTVILTMNVVTSDQCCLEILYFDWTYVQSIPPENLKVSTHGTLVTKHEIINKKYIYAQWFIYVIPRLVEVVTFKQMYLCMKKAKLHVDKTRTREECNFCPIQYRRIPRIPTVSGTCGKVAILTMAHR